MILITGGAGFIGSALVRKAISQSDTKILNIDKLTYAGSLSNLAKLTDLKNYHNHTFIKADINNVEELENIFTKNGFFCYNRKKYLGGIAYLNIFSKI